MALAQAIAPRDVDGQVPLSFAQQRLWYFDRLAPGSPVYNRPLVLRLTGELDVSALRLAIDDIVRRHEVLAAAFVMQDGTAVQVRSQALPRLALDDLADVPTAARVAEALARARAETRRPFDLAQGPPMRALLLRLAADDHLLVFTFHHIVFDGWSAGVLLQELGACYGARLAGSEPALPALRLAYADFAVWQHTSAQRERLARQLDYWRTRLQGAPGILDVPTDHPRPAARSFSGDRRSLQLPRALGDDLKRVSARHGATLYMTLLAAFAVLLRRYTGEDDVVVGSPAAGRTRLELEGLIGCFINTLPIRIDVAGDPPFTTLLGRVRAAALGAFTHQEAPLQAIVEAVRPERDHGRAPLFQVLFNMRNLPVHAPQFAGLSVSEIEVDAGAVAVDLSLEATARPDGLRLVVEFSTELFEAATIERMLRHFSQLLKGIAEDPAARISALPLLTEDERRELTRFETGPVVQGWADACVHERIQRTAARTPDSPAVACGSAQLTYGELDFDANRLAAHLRRLGVGPEVLVGVCLERSLQMAVALLAVLKAGGAYVPLDPDYPPDRLAWMIRDSSPRVIVTQSSLVGRLPADVGATLVRLDADAEVIERCSTETVASGVTALNAAYVIYTSGSGGTPRGVLVPHGCMVNHNMAVVEAYALRESDRVLQFASLNFDASVEEIFPTWIAGAALVLRTDEVLGSATSFLRALRRERITVLNLPTAYWHAWVRELSRSAAEPPPSLRLVIVGGEKASADVFRAWTAFARGRVRWLNTYGPTEATVIVSLWDPSVDPVPPGDALPIGRPIANTRMHVLDTLGQRVPVGIPGELFVGGACVARGYLNDAERSAQRFVPDPLSGDAGARMFRTGDRARWRADGLLEFLARTDRQIKLRGFRIEPEEVEAALRAHGDVHDAAVVLREDMPGAPNLAAYIVAAGAPAPAAGVLKNHLRACLPEFMVPATVTALDALPRDASGKVDRRALPPPENGASCTPTARRDARNATEQRLVAIFEDTLGVRGIAATEDFFALGGHSLLALRLATRIEEAFGCAFPLSTLLEGATPEALATRLAAPPSTLVAIQPGGTLRPFFCVHEFFGDVFLYEPLARHLGPDQPFYGLQAHGPDDEDEIADVAAMAERYVRAIRAVQPEGPYALGGLCAGGMVALEMSRQLTASGEEVELLALLDTSATPFAWKRAPQPLRTVLRGLPDWIGGLGQLTPGQWRELVRLKFGAASTQAAAAVRFLTRREPSARAADRLGMLADSLGLPQHRRRVAALFRRGLLDYSPQPYAGRVVLFRARVQPLFDPQDEAKGWRPLARGEFEVRVVPGNHLAMLQEPHVRVLARELSTCLARARGRTSALPTAAPPLRV